MQYALLIYTESGDQELPASVSRALQRERPAPGGDPRSQGKLLGSAMLSPVSTATTIRVRDDDTLVDDGPFAETKERLGGFYLIEAETLDDAIDWAARIPSARTGKVEIRPVIDTPERRG